MVFCGQILPDCTFVLLVWWLACKNLEYNSILCCSADAVRCGVVWRHVLIVVFQYHTHWTLTGSSLFVNHSSPFYVCTRQNRDSRRVVTNRCWHHDWPCVIRAGNVLIIKFESDGGTWRHGLGCKGDDEIVGKGNIIIAPNIDEGIWQDPTVNSIVKVSSCFVIVDICTAAVQSWETSEGHLDIWSLELSICSLVAEKSVAIQAYFVNKRWAVTWKVTAQYWVGYYDCWSGLGQFRFADGPCFSWVCPIPRSDSPWHRDVIERGGKIFGLRELSRGTPSNIINWCTHQPCHDKVPSLVKGPVDPAMSSVICRRSADVSGRFGVVPWIVDNRSVLVCILLHVQIVIFRLKYFASWWRLPEIAAFGCCGVHTCDTGGG